MPSAQQVADYFVRVVDEDSGDSMSNLRLQKILYYAQAWYLANFGGPLFADDFEAWMYGPVIPSLYRKYRDYGNGPIPRSRRELDLDDRTRELLDEVWDVYGIYSPTQLMNLTHREGPWIEARGDIDPGAPCKCVISKEAMRDYYAAKLSV